MVGKILEYPMEKPKDDDDDDGFVSVGGLAVEMGATFKNGELTLEAGHPVDLVIDIPRLGLKSGGRAKIVSVKGDNIFEIAAWSESMGETVFVVVERNWVIPVLPRDKQP
jgi:hypothetical protein